LTSITPPSNSVKWRLIAKPKPEPPFEIEGGDLDAESPPQAPASPGGMIGEGGPDPGDGQREGGMIGEG
jgi:hypothetical protein